MYIGKIDCGKATGSHVVVIEGRSRSTTTYLDIKSLQTITMVSFIRNSSCSINSCEFRMELVLQG